MMLRRSRGLVAQASVAHAEATLAHVETELAALKEAIRSGASQADRRRRHTALRRAYLDADAALRQLLRKLATAPYPLRTYWRGRLSELGVARQKHLFLERDDGAVLAPGTVRATDTGMSYPDLHDHIHGRVLVPDTPATYGLPLPLYTDLVDAPSPSAVAWRRVEAVPALPAAGARVSDTVPTPAAHPSVTTPTPAAHPSVTTPTPAAPATVTERAPAVDESAQSPVRAA